MTLDGDYMGNHQIPHPSFTLSNPRASDEAKRVMEYLSGTYTRYVIAGQHTNLARGGECEFIHRETGKYPALRGFDLLSRTAGTETLEPTEHCLYEVQNNRGSLDTAIEWAAGGGLLTFCWHWFSPLIGRDKSFYTKNTGFDIRQALTDGTAEHAALMRDLDVIANELMKLKALRIPVLWRPLHEADGGWFWWGARGPEPYLALWRLMYELFTGKYALDNLIWVHNAPADGWYVGDGYCDITGSDIYSPNFDYDPLCAAFERNRALCNGQKPVALTENGTIPDPGRMFGEGAYWMYFMSWDWDQSTDCWHRITPEQLSAVYNHERVVTLDKLKL